ncbi:NAD-dependent epimerase/dehydratase family protein [Aurantiacibacter poecillastricola]|uniref:NAD-dependent epimerase/dehydratase family protein n=1 Tax=Aurantiacibacter poecillastricola TaxID=3064385 RepID=UPI00273D5FD5|nr:NAD(P)H-binding protein [Aurantiacibacter sp. 219JJ12-13]MDP5262899.1 NAD(P)H-binding protein [Aurantiacibacter sp. 219JJ12-13]
MTLAITGSTGFVGQAVLEDAGMKEIRVKALARRPQSARPGIDWVRGDLADRQALAELVRGCSAVIHIAGVVNAPDAIGFIAGNVAGTEAVLEAAGEAGVKRFIHVSSLAAKEPDLSLYGHSKRLAENAVEESDLDWTIVRPPAVYGPRDTELLELFKAARWRVVPMPPPGRASIIHVADLASLLVTLAQENSDTIRHIYEPDDGRGEGWSHRELAKAIGRAVGRSVWAPHMPRRALMAAAQADRFMRGEGAKLTPDRASYMAHPDWTSDPARACPRDLWHATIPTREGLEDTARWYRENGFL